MADGRGWIRISRKFFDSDPDWAEEREYSRAEAWLDVVQMAAYSGHVRRIGLRSFPLKRGEVLLSVRFLSRRWQWSSARVHRWIAMCLETGRLSESGNTSEGNIYLLDKYEVYQSSRNTSDDAFDDACGSSGDRGNEHKEKEGKKKKEKKEWVPSEEYLAASEAYRSSLTGAERDQYRAKKSEETFYFVQWNALKSDGHESSHAHSLLVAACKGWRFDDWPERKTTKNHTFSMVIGTMRNIYNFSALDAKDDEENDRILAQLELEMSLDANQDPLSN